MTHYHTDMDYQSNLKHKMAAWQVEAGHLERRLDTLDIGKISVKQWEAIYYRYSALQDYISEGLKRIAA